MCMFVHLQQIIWKNPINHLNFQKTFQDDHSFYLKKQQY